jgi:LacI family transcriptional regulator
MAAPMSVNMQSVAQAAGVSIMTVSRVIHQNPKVAKATRERVLAQLSQQGYRRTPFLAAWKVRVKGDIISEHPNVVFLCGYPEKSIRKSPVAEIYRAVEEHAHSLGLRAGFFHADLTGNKFSAISNILQARGVRGVVVGPFPEGSQPIALPWQRFAVAATDYDQNLQGVNRAAQNHYSDTKRIFEHLLAGGYSRPGFVAMPGQRTDQWLGAFLERQWWLPEADKIPVFRAGTSDPIAALQSWCKNFRPDIILCPFGKGLKWIDGLPSKPKKPDIFVLDLPPERSNDSANLTGMVYPATAIGKAAVNLLAAQLRNYEQGLPARPKTLRVEGTFQEGRG